MNSIIAKHRDYATVYFITVFTKKDPTHINFIRRKYIVRQTCPEPDWDQEIYSYDNRKSQLKLEWVLPTEQDSKTILKNKDVYDPILVKCIQDFKKSKLKIPSYSP